MELDGDSLRNLYDPDITPSSDPIQRNDLGRQSKTSRSSYPNLKRIAIEDIDEDGMGIYSESLTDVTQESNSPTSVKFDQNPFEENEIKPAIEKCPQIAECVSSGNNGRIAETELKSAIPTTSTNTEPHDLRQNVASILEQVVQDDSMEMEHRRSVTDIKDLGVGPVVEKPKKKSVRARVADLAPDQIHCCPYEGCPKRFAKKYNLKIHVRRHTGELPFTCNVLGCSKRFMWHSSFLRHQRSHERRRRKRRGKSKLQEQLRSSQQLMESLFPTERAPTTQTPDEDPDPAVHFPFEHLANSYSFPSSSKDTETTESSKSVGELLGANLPIHDQLPNVLDIVKLETSQWTPPPTDKVVLDDPHIEPLSLQEQESIGIGMETNAGNLDDDLPFGNFDLSLLSRQEFFGGQSPVQSGEDRSSFGL
eukprot:Plantae.Rhodophyta-Hildenbrandia_rubra.ctg11030.p1 GENE.Plantae.Rhodophyta-Hildenbrandia_rubra.ctg11030~~Plantae.Rhodophyta-Hildenbrandia_rubra.ctg11030.p1  ORF type:complete len:421 (-),score=65.74 Plantae.Rhodophyta-Hildenbrandia_rubra.ctg11030:303-1565(-)